MHHFWLHIMTLFPYKGMVPYYDIMTIEAIELIGTMPRIIPLDRRRGLLKSLKTEAAWKTHIIITYLSSLNVVW